MTRKLLLVEVYRETSPRQLAWRIDDLLVSEPRELPTAEALGRVAIAALYREHDGLVGILEPPEEVGQAILDALTKRTEGGEGDESGLPGIKRA